MIIKFSMDRIKNMDQIYTWTPIHSEKFGCDGAEEHYHGKDDCKLVVADMLRTLNWGTQEYLGTLERIAKEVFNRPQRCQAHKKSDKKKKIQMKIFKRIYKMD